MLKNKVVLSLGQPTVNAIENFWSVDPQSNSNEPYPRNSKEMSPEALEQQKRLTSPQLDSKQSSASVIADFLELTKPVQQKSVDGESVAGPPSSSERSGTSLIADFLGDEIPVQQKSVDGESVAGPPSSSERSGTSLIADFLGDEIPVQQKSVDGESVAGPPSSSERSGTSLIADFLGDEIPVQQTSVDGEEYKGPSSRGPGIGGVNDSMKRATKSYNGKEKRERSKSKDKRVLHELPFQVLTGRSGILSGGLAKEKRRWETPVSEKRMAVLLAELNRKGLLEYRDEDLYWSFSARKFWTKSELIPYKFNGPEQLKIKNYNVTIGTMYEVKLLQTAGTNLGTVRVQFSRLDELWMAHAVLLERPKFRVKDPEKLLFAHPLNKSKKLPIITRRVPSGENVRFLAPGHSYEDRQICSMMPEYQFEPAYDSDGYCNEKFVPTMSGGRHRFALEKETLTKLKLKASLELRTFPYKGTVLLCPETGDIVERVRVPCWSTVPLSNTESLSSQIHPKIGKGVLTHDPDGTSSPKRIIVGHPIEPGLDFRKFPPKYSDIHTIEALQDKTGYINEDTKSSKFTFSSQFIRLAPILEHGVNHHPDLRLKYLACTTRDLETTIGPAFDLSSRISGKFPAEHILRVPERPPKIPSVPNMKGKQFVYGEEMPSLAEQTDEIVSEEVDARRSLVLSELAWKRRPGITDERLLELFNLHIESFRTMQQHFYHFIGKNPHGEKVYTIDFSVLRLRPHEQLILYELQYVINHVNEDMREYRLSAAHDRLMFFLENRLFREYFQIVSSEIIDMILREDVVYRHSKDRYSFWDSPRGYTLAAVYWKVVYLLDRLLHPFWPLITECMNNIDEKDPYKPMACLFYPCTNIAAPDYDLSKGYPIFVSPKEDIRFKNPDLGMPVISDVGFMTKDTTEDLSIVYEVLKAFQYLRYESRKKILEKNAQDPDYLVSPKDKHLLVTNPILASESIGSDNVYPDYNYQNFYKDRGGDTSRIGIIVLKGYDRDSPLGRLLGVYMEDIARRAQLATIQILGDDQGLSNVIVSFKIADSASVHLVSKLPSSSSQPEAESSTSSGQPEAESSSSSSQSEADSSTSSSLPEADSPPLKQL
ncbi:hypothetical protein BZA70DRAFT_143914 [Myxozyma melibiosi]|uniref:Methionyl/Valyl/Leucyl/Isoleucyl-tRNA synthetase anticodon-binding domain-containing protein n=1 Tax=Myxozyma melibiosi TaxID=54550 RepID=A0ABR1F7Q5_9ASCO